jgi:ribosome-binding protein aMBF1 (putative translation factor)
MANEECAHCGTLITEWSTTRTVDARVFCCPNCANAYSRAQQTPNEARRDSA